MTVYAVMCCKKVPKTLPRNIASKHRVCTDIASKIKELGYQGECGYNQLLYPVASTTRHLIAWIVSALPRADVILSKYSIT